MAAKGNQMLRLGIKRPALLLYRVPSRLILFLFSERYCSTAARSRASTGTETGDSPAAVWCEKLLKVDATYREGIRREYSCLPEANIPSPCRRRLGPRAFDWPPDLLGLALQPTLAPDCPGQVFPGECLSYPERWRWIVVKAEEPLGKPGHVT